LIHFYKRSEYQNPDEWYMYFKEIVILLKMNKKRNVKM